MGDISISYFNCLIKHSNLNKTAINYQNKKSVTKYYLKEYFILIVCK